jgi:hypothetical protein
VGIFGAVRVVVLNTCRRIKSNLFAYSQQSKPMRLIRNTLADALALLDREVVHCRWRWLCVLPGLLWTPMLENELND